ncbi:hypothetical protein [Sphingomonas sp. LT1P40]|uniref:hypothetical protein n=1 Tax=Alteristakelama amylovorans TaxID=3096166 RepID=UPI002FC70C55
MIWLAAMLVAFRDPVFSGFDLGFGDRADGIIEISLLEHWRNVFTGHAVWNTPGYFHPHTGTLGYNDGYFLYGLVYSFWRIWFDPFLSDTLNAATFKTMGFIASWWLVRRTLGWQAPVALLVAAIFTINNSMAIHTVHAQLQSVGLLPVAMILAIGTVRAAVAGASSRARGFGIALALLMAAWLITAYYMAWFTLWFGCIFILCWLIGTGNWRPRAVLTLLRAHWVTLALCGSAFVVAVIPFLSVYLPKAGESGGHGYWKMLGYLVTPVDLVNTGPGNLIWGWINRGIQALFGAFTPDPKAPGRAFGGEHESGFPLFLFVLTVAAAWRVLRRRIPADPVLFAYALAIVVSWALTLQLWVASPWGAIFHLVPGAKGLRVVLRYQTFLVLPVLLLVAAVFRDRLTALLTERRVLGMGVVALLLIEQLNSFSAAQLSRSAWWTPLTVIPAPPSECRSFYAVQTRVGEPLYRNAEMHAKHPHNDDAMLLAQIWRVPTLGGYSTFQPKDWVFVDPLKPDYDARAARYIASHRLTGVCRLDVRDAQPWWRIS